MFNRLTNTQKARAYAALGVVSFVVFLLGTAALVSAGDVSVLTEILAGLGLAALSLTAFFCDYEWVKYSKRSIRERLMNEYYEAINSVDQPTNEP